MRTLVIHQDHASVVHLTQGGESHGDAMAYEGPVTGPDGLSGVVAGVNHTARLDGADHAFRVGTAAFRFDGDDSISVSGVVRYAPDQAYSTAGTRHVSAIIGGTGRYLGARGQLESVRNADGSFTHTFTLL